MRDHIDRIRSFMVKAGQHVPSEPVIPNDKTVKLRAELILEEALETIHALGYSVRLMTDVDLELKDLQVVKTGNIHDFANEVGVAAVITEIADGCADLSVVTIGTLLAFGLSPPCIEGIYYEVDESNLDKFMGGYENPETGKWMKPEDWQPPDILGTINYHSK